MLFCTSTGITTVLVISSFEITVILVNPSFTALIELFSIFTIESSELTIEQDTLY